MASSPLVSVIIPTRNRKDLLVSAIRSVLNQTYPHLQIIVHDNCSTDGTASLIHDEFNDERLEYYRIDHDLSMTENWSKAFQYVKGHYFVRLDDDNVFLNDFVETALHEMQRLKLRMINFNPLLIKPSALLYSIFDNEAKTYALHPAQLLYLEYFALTDSNYAVYETSLIRDLFPKGDVYQTALPDRYMTLKVLEAGAPVGFSPWVKGVTRFDNQRPSFFVDHEFAYIDYAAISPYTVVKGWDCHYNFGMHRLTTTLYSLKESGNQALSSFFEHAITSPLHFLTAMRLGHVYSLKGTALYSWNELLAHQRYLWMILFGILRHPFAMLEGNPAWKHLHGLLLKTFPLYVSSLRNILLRRQRCPSSVQMSFGDRLIEKVLLNKNPIPSRLTSLKGSFPDFLKSFPKNS